MTLALIALIIFFIIFGIQKLNSSYEKTSRFEQGEIANKCYNQVCKELNYVDETGDIDAFCVANHSLPIKYKSKTSLFSEYKNILGAADRDSPAFLSARRQADDYSKFLQDFLIAFYKKSRRYYFQYCADNNIKTYRDTEALKKFMELFNAYIYKYCIANFYRPFNINDYKEYPLREFLRVQCNGENIKDWILPKSYYYDIEKEPNEEDNKFGNDKCKMDERIRDALRRKLDTTCSLQVFFYEFISKGSQHNRDYFMALANNEYNKFLADLIKLDGFPILPKVSFDSIPDELNIKKQPIIWQIIMNAKISAPFRHNTMQNGLISQEIKNHRRQPDFDIFATSPILDSLELENIRKKDYPWLKISKNE